MTLKEIHEVLASFEITFLMYDKERQIKEKNDPYSFSHKHQKMLEGLRVVGKKM